MTFRQQNGPSASARQVQRLAALLEGAGYDDFRSARGPLRLTQRQGLGKFTSTEADGLIELLEHVAAAAIPEDVAPDPPASVTPRPLRDAPTDELVAELRLRGWDASKG